jgi:hypothetical protein
MRVMNETKQHISRKKKNKITPKQNQNLARHLDCHFSAIFP